MICVIGSGPTGISAAFALTKAGHTVLMLDAGITLEPWIQGTVSRMANTEKNAWKPADIDVLKEKTRATTNGVPLKYLYGSDFPYRDAEAGIKLLRRQADLLPSFAKGGLTNVWGGAVLPNCEQDIAEWPISVNDLAPHYRAINEFMPLSGTRDELESLFPLYGEPGSIPLSQQAAHLLRDLRSNPISGLKFGRSRLAVSNGCVGCGMCMYGCPYELIYNSAETLSSLRTLPNFTYQSATIVRRLEEIRGQVIIQVENGDETTRVCADAVFLAAGTLPSTRIILQSLDAYDHPLQLKNSQYFLFPLLRRQRTSGAMNEELHTLSQAFLELFDPSLSPFMIHMQCYTYNELFKDALQQKLGILAGMFPMAFLLERLLLIQGYLHSDISAPMQLILRRDCLELVGQPYFKTDAIINAVMKKLRPLGFAFSPKAGQPGRGFHSGASLPMRTAPAPYETDIWGRPYGFERVHVVDASVLPTIPATTITYTAMANAHRIASEYCHLPRPTIRAKCCAITGANGYVGKILANYLRKQGIEVIPLVRSPFGAGRAYSLETPVDPGTLKGVDFLVHAAYDFSITDFEELRKINIEGSRRLFAAAREAKVKQVVFISTMSAFDGCLSHYGRTKLAIEAIAMKYDHCIVRPGLVFGPQPGGMLGALRRLAGRKIIPLVGNGDQQLYIAHQDDLAHLVHQLLTKLDTKRVNLMAAAHCQPLTIKQIIGGLNSSKHYYLRIPKSMALTGLRFIEYLGFSSRLRRDSLVSLLTPAPPPDFSYLEKNGIHFRPLYPEQG